MPNPFHDETGKFSSADEMGAAVQRLANEGRFEEAFKLSNEYHAASKSELEATIAAMKDFGVPEPAAADNVTSIAAARSKKPQVATKPKAAAVKAPAVPANTFALPKTHTYRPEGVTPGEGGEYYSRKFTGNKAADSYRSVTDIAKDVRNDLTEAQEKGYLPKGLKFSVTGDKYSGGQSMRVKIQGGKDKDLFVTGDENVRPEFGQQIYTEEAREVLKRVQGVVDAYRWDASEPQVDYFNTNFYGFVDIESERSAAFREKEAAAAKAQREGYKQRKEVLGKSPAEQDSLFFNHANQGTQDNSGSYGFIPGTRLLLVEGNAKRYTFRGEETKYVKEIYDLTGYTVRGGGNVEDSLKKLDLFDLRSSFSNHKFFPPKPAKARRR